MIRTFAWCGMYTSTSSIVWPALLEYLLGRGDEYPRGELEHLAAVHVGEVLSSATVSALAGNREPPAG